MKPTQEQEAAIENFLSGKNSKINARAGSGKTSTLKLCSAATAAPKIYIAFNKAIATEAQKAFPENTKCSTAHSLAYRSVGRAYAFNANKLTVNLRARDAAIHLSLPPLTQISSDQTISDTTVAYITLETIKKFCQSGEQKVENSHFFAYPKLTELDIKDFLPFRDKIVMLANRLWAEMSSTKTTTPLGFDGYLKVWELSSPSIEYPVLMVDEFQDLNGVLLSVLKNQMAQLVCVGDPDQQIYSWRGAVNAMELFPCQLNSTLTKSFRFGPEIASLATNMLRTISPGAFVTGLEGKDSKIVLSFTEKPTVIFRKNASILEYVLSSKDPKKCFVQGGVSEIFSLLEGLHKLANKKPSSHHELLGFKDLTEVETYAKNANDANLQRIIKIYNSNDHSTLMNCLDKIPTYYVEGMQILTTAHKSKGNEYKNVELFDDFPEQGGEDGKFNKDETRLIYVAATRAMENLKIPFWMNNLYMKAGE